MSLPPPPFSLSLLGAAPPPPPDGAANSWPSLPYMRELFFPCDVEAWRVSSLSRDVGRSPAGLMSSSARGMKVCYRCGLELISLSQGRPVYSELLCERQSGSKSISLSPSPSPSPSLSLPGNTSAWSSQSAPDDSTFRRPGYSFTRSIGKQIKSPARRPGARSHCRLGGASGAASG